MSFFAAQEKVVEIDSENRITVRRLTWGENEEIKSAATQMKMSVPMARGKGQQAAAVEDGEIVIDPYKTKREMVLRSVVSWAGPGFEDRPVTRENILALPEWIVDLVAEAVDGLNEGLSDEAKKI